MYHNIPVDGIMYFNMVFLKLDFGLSEAFVQRIGQDVIPISNIWTEQVDDVVQWGGLNLTNPLEVPSRNGIFYSSVEVFKAQSEFFKSYVSVKKSVSSEKGWLFSWKSWCDKSWKIFQAYWPLMYFLQFLCGVFCQKEKKLKHNFVSTKPEKVNRTTLMKIDCFYLDTSKSKTTCGGSKWVEMINSFHLCKVKGLVIDLSI